MFHYEIRENEEKTFSYEVPKWELKFNKMEEFFVGKTVRTRFLC